MNNLLNLKSKYKTLTGQEFKPANSSGRKKEKGKSSSGNNKHEKKQEKKPSEQQPSQDEKGGKKVTRCEYNDFNYLLSKLF